MACDYSSLQGDDGNNSGVEGDLRRPGAIELWLRHRRDQPDAFAHELAALPPQYQELAELLWQLLTAEEAERLAYLMN